MQIGIDYRPALVNREGIGRATRELVRALVQTPNPDFELNLFGWTLAKPRFDKQSLGLVKAQNARLFRRRFPARITRAWLALQGGAPYAMDMQNGVFHHTQPRRLPTGKSPTTTMIWDLLFLDDDGRAGGPFVDLRVARSMALSSRRAADESSALLVPTEFVRQEVIEKLGVEKERVHVVGLGCEHILPLKINNPETRPPFVLTVCRVEPRKNHLVMLEAFERLVRSGLPHHWLVVGPDSWGSKEFDAALERSPARHKVQRIKNAPEAELAGLYSTADIFLFASRAEGFGLPPLEAMSAGVPTIAASASCLTEVLGDGARLVPPDDDEAIFEALSDVICNSDVRDELVRRAYKRAAMHSWPAAAKRHLEVWRTLFP